MKIKKYSLILVFLLITQILQSQILITLLLGDKLNSDGLEFGLEGGLNWTSISGMESQSFARKWNMGFYFDIRIKNQWSLYTGILVKSNMGNDKLTDKDLDNLGASKYIDSSGTALFGTYSQKMSYFLVPVLIKYHFKNHFYTELGPQFGLMYHSWIEFKSDIDGKDAIVKEYNRNIINKIDAGAMFGLGYKLLKGSGWTIGVKYYLGFVDVYKNIPETKNSSFFVKLNIPIGVSEKPEKLNTN